MGGKLMARKVEGVSERLLDCAKEEFLEKGFKDASLRNIAEKAGSSTGAIYIRYPDKEALFNDLVSETIESFFSQFRDAQDKHFELIDQERTNRSKDLSQSYLYRFISYIYDHYDAFKLVLCCSVGTKYERFIHDLVDLEVEVAEKYYARLREIGKLEGHVSREVHHMLTSAYYTAIFEIVVHDMYRENALLFIEEISKFFNTGWNSLLEFS
jgi:AcrR family transcriptional regulator